MQALTTETVKQYCNDTKDLAAILQVLIDSKAITPNIITTAGEIAAACENLLEVCSKVL